MKFHFVVNRTIAKLAKFARSWYAVSSSMGTDGSFSRKKRESNFRGGAFERKAPEKRKEARETNSSETLKN